MTSTMSGRDFVEFSLSIGAIELLSEGRELKSGRLSPYFFNSGLFCDGKSLRQLALAYGASILASGRGPQVLFGPAYKGIPLVSAIAAVGNENPEINWGWACNRKEVKDHGEGGAIIGANCNGQRVEIIDDVITTGASILEADNIIKYAGGEVTGATIAFDRQECGADPDRSAVQEFATDHKIPITAAATLTDLVHVLRNNSAYNDILRKIEAYRERYGVT